MLYRPHCNPLFIPTLRTPGRPLPCPQVRFFDMITIAVPPALPACLTIATVFSIGRLRKKGVYVTSPDRITLAGQLDVICFDKTGGPGPPPPPTTRLAPTVPAFIPCSLTASQQALACTLSSSRNPHVEKCCAAA